MRQWYDGYYSSVYLTENQKQYLQGFTEESFNEYVKEHLYDELIRTTEKWTLKMACDFMGVP